MQSPQAALNNFYDTNYREDQGIIDAEPTASLQDRVIELEQILQGIATLWPEPNFCADLSVNGVNDGRSRLITAHYAVNAARRALGLPLHKFPGKED